MPEHHFAAGSVTALSRILTFLKRLLRLFQRSKPSASSTSLIDTKPNSILPSIMRKNTPFNWKLVEKLGKGFTPYGDAPNRRQRRASSQKQSRRPGFGKHVRRWQVEAFRVNEKGKTVWASNFLAFRILAGRNTHIRRIAHWIQG